METQPNQSKPYPDNLFQLINIDKGTVLWYQVAILVRLRSESGVSSVHEIGGGGGISGLIVRNLGFKYSVFEELQSQRDLDSALLQLSTEERIAEVVCAFQVLEHNSLEDFGVLTRRLRDLTQRFVVISLPVSKPYLRIEIEPKLFSGYSIISRTRIAVTWFLPRWLFPRPRHTRIKAITQTTTLGISANESSQHSIVSRNHLWEVGDRNASLKSLISLAQESGIRLVRLSYAPFFPKQVFLEFEKDSPRTSP